MEHTNDGYLSYLCVNSRLACLACPHKASIHTRPRRNTIRITGYRLTGTRGSVSPCAVIQPVCTRISHQSFHSVYFYTDLELLARTEPSWSLYNAPISNLSPTLLLISKHRQAVLPHRPHRAGLFRSLHILASIRYTALRPEL